MATHTFSASQIRWNGILRRCRPSRTQRAQVFFWSGRCVCREHKRPSAFQALRMGYVTHLPTSSSHLYYLLATHFFNIIVTDRLAKSRKGFLTKSMLQKILSIHRTSICTYAKRLQSHGGTHQFSTPPKETKWGMSEDRP